MSILLCSKSCFVVVLPLPICCNLWTYTLYYKTKRILFFIYNLNITALYYETKSMSFCISICSHLFLCEVVLTVDQFVNQSHFYRFSLSFIENESREMSRNVLVI